MRFPDYLCGRLVAWSRQGALRMTLQTEAVKKEGRLARHLTTMNSESSGRHARGELY